MHKTDGTLNVYDLMWDHKVIYTYHILTWPSFVLEIGGPFILEVNPHDGPQSDPLYYQSVMTLILGIGI